MAAAGGRRLGAGGRWAGLRRGWAWASCDAGPVRRLFCLQPPRWRGRRMGAALCSIPDKRAGGAEEKRSGGERSGAGPPTAAGGGEAARAAQSWWLLAGGLGSGRGPAGGHSAGTPGGLAPGSPVGRWILVRDGALVSGGLGWGALCGASLQPVFPACPRRPRLGVSLPLRARTPEGQRRPRCRCGARGWAGRERRH